jgi:Skp family chaperone for outer membrane proteins
VVQTPGANAAPAARIAVVDMNAVLDAYKVASDRRKSLAELAEKYEAILGGLSRQKQDLVAKYKEKDEARSAFDPAKVEFRELTAEMKRIEGEVSALEAERNLRAQTYEAELEQQNQQFMLHVYDELIQAIAKIAERQGIDLVVRIEADTKEESLRKQMSQMMMRQVVYSAKDLDITRSVIDLLNSKK